MGVKCSVLIIKTIPEDRIAMADRRDDTEKQDRLREAGTLNRAPEKVGDPMFAAAVDSPLRASGHVEIRPEPRLRPE